MVALWQRHFNNRRFILSASLFIACAPVFAVSQNNSIKATVSNEFSHRVTVSIDGEFKCEVAVNSTCTFQITKGKHLFGYRRDDGSSISSPNEVPSSYDELCIHLGEKGVSYDDCDAGFLGGMVTAISMDSLIKSANEKNAKNDYDGAIADATKAIGLDPNFGPPYIARGDARRGKEDYDGAIADYTKALGISTIFAGELNPKLAAAYFGRGHARGDYEGAIADYTKAIELDPNYASAYYQRGIARNNKKDLDGAIADFTKAIEINPKWSWYYVGRGHTRGRTKDFDGAISDYTKAIELDPKNAGAYCGRAGVNLDLNKGAAAYSDVQKYLEMEGKACGISEIILTGYLGLRKSHRDDAADQFLDSSAKLVDTSDWHNQIIRYLRHEITEQQLLALANDNWKMTKAHTYVGMNMSLSGNRQAALNHFHWVVEHGEYKDSLVESELRRLEAATPGKPQ